MKIIRASLDDTDLFDKNHLDFGACCFYSEDRKCKYFFSINKQEATLYMSEEQFVDEAIDEFVFYSGFVTTIRNSDGRVLKERNVGKLAPCLISEIQPSQFYISELKLQNCKKWLTNQSGLMIPVVVKDGKTIALDGHTRLRAALDLGFETAQIFSEEYDDYIFTFANEAIRRGIRSVSDMEIVSAEEYKIKWHKYCDDIFGNQNV